MVAMPAMVILVVGQCARMPRADDPAQMAAHFLAGRCLAWPQNDRHGASGRGVVNMDRKKATLIIMRVEQRQLLMTMRDIASIVDIERDGLRRRGVTGAIKIDEDAAQLHMISRKVGAFSQRDMVGCEHRSCPVSGNRPQASLNAGSFRR